MPITVSGVPPPLNAIVWPSGLFPSGTPGHDLTAFLASFNANFGFNLTPHTFQMEFIPQGDPDAFHGASGQLAPIGSNFELYIGNFFVKGYVTHADYTSSKDGTICNVSVEDYRKTLRKVKIHTEDLGENVPSGVVSVARAFRKINGISDPNANVSDPLAIEYGYIQDIGATYPQIIAAIDYTFNEGKCAISINDLPTADKLQANVGLIDLTNVRWQFSLEMLDEAMSRVLSDCGFDWYWNMGANNLAIINRKQPFLIEESNILDIVSQVGAASGLDQTQQIGFGHDITPDATKFRLLGGHQQGMINSELLSPIDGVDTSALDGKIVFTKIWDQLSIGFYDADGFYRTYVPSERELQIALAGIEQWSYFKKYQADNVLADPPGFGMSPDPGSIAAQDPSFQSRLDPIMPLAGEATSAGQSGIRIISNRRDAEHNWTLDFYNRVQNHASRHYARSYIASGILFNNASGLFRLIDSAWTNVENQIQGDTLSPSGSISGLFTEDYEINRRLGPVSPFLADDFRVAAYCVLPKDTVYGPQGDDVPASFANWTEDAPPFNPSGDGRHYIPVTLAVVGHRVINPRSNDLYSFEAFPEGTLYCQLPINAGPASGLLEDGVIHNLVTLISTNNKFTGSGLFDIINPAIVLNAYPILSGVAIPVEVRARYGQGYPTTWESGTLNPREHEVVQVDDQFVPWAFFPVGTKTSLAVMTDRAMFRVNSKVVPTVTSTYGDFTEIGLPVLSFDSFASQIVNDDGLYGAIVHGVNEVNFGFSSEGFVTRYKIQSYYPHYGKEAPLGERTRGLLNGIINPIDFTFLKIGNPAPAPPINPFLQADALAIPLFADSEQRAVRVKINQVNNIFTLFSVGDPQEERYRGIDTHGYTKPYQNSISSEPDFRLGAICIDGFLNVDDSAVYHTDAFENPGGTTILRYFSGGRSIGNGTIVTVAQQNADNPNNVDVVISDTNNANRAIKNVPVLNGTINIGDRTTLVSQGNASVKPGPAVAGVYINGAFTSAGVVPVGIIEVQNPGTITATATCQQLNSDGNIEDTGTIYSGVLPIPYRQFAASGDKGFLATATVPSPGGSGSGVSVSFIEIVKPAFIRFG